MTQERFDELFESYPEIVARMMWHQSHQGRLMVFGPQIDDHGIGKGFCWKYTPEGVDFWKNIMNGKPFDEEKIPFFERGDIISMMFGNKPKDYIFFDWDLEHGAVLVMTKTAWDMLNNRLASETMHQDLRKMPLQNIVW